MTTIQCDKSMNTLIKEYMNTFTSLLSFLSAFMSALEIQKESVEFSKYKEIGYDIFLKTLGFYEK